MLYTHDYTYKKPNTEYINIEEFIPNFFHCYFKDIKEH